MSGVPNATQRGPTQEHTKARTEDLIRLVTRIHEIEGRLEEIEDDVRRHWFQLTMAVLVDKQHSKPARKLHICPACNEIVELRPDRKPIIKDESLKPPKRRKKGASTPSIPESSEVLE